MENTAQFSYRPNGLFMLTVILQVILLALVAFIYPTLPERIPTHFGFSGTVTAWGEKSTILLLPAISLICHLIMVWMARHPEKLNYPMAITPQNREKNYRQAASLLHWLAAAVIVVMLLIVLATYRSAVNIGVGISPVWVVGLFVLAVTSAAFWSLKMKSQG